MTGQDAPRTERGRGIQGALERSWYAAPGAAAWSRLLAPAAALYGAASAAARARAMELRRSAPDGYVVSIGGLTVGGAGKTSLSRWLARELAARGARPAILLRGHGGQNDPFGTFVVPDFEGYPLHVAFERAGDEAAAHRAALDSSAVVASDRDRHRAAAWTGAGYGARLWILDDGWEQRTLRWNELWVAVDPRLPVGNGALLPAGPLRRPAATLREAAVIAFVLDESDEEVSREMDAWTVAHAPSATRLRFRRALEGTSRLGDRAAEAWRAGTRAALVSGVGAPGRLTRFVRSSGIDLVSHAAFPDHARWSVPDLSRAVERAAAMGAEVVLITEKDEPRWPESLSPRLPVRVLRSTLRPLDPVDRALEGMIAGSRAGNAAPAKEALRR